MAFPPEFSALSDQSGRGLTADLITLAGTPDDGSQVRALLRSITQLAADLLPAVSYASTTAHREDGYVTVAMSSEMALAVDEAQYADDTGPCLDALRTAEPTVVPRIDATVNWPGFRQAASRFGLCASLSIPVFGGRGTPIAALNLYGRDTLAMAPLNAAVTAAFEISGEEGTGPKQGGLDPGALQLVDGLIGAFAVRARIQVALGVIMAVENTNADAAYAVLRSRAATAASSLVATAEAVVAWASDQPSA